MNGKKGNSKKTKLRGEVRGFLFAYFLLWLVLGTMFLVKIIPPACNVMLLQDNRQYVEEQYNPNDWESRDEAYTALVDYNNSLINSDDVIISFFFNKTILVKLLIVVVAATPYLIILKLIVDASDRRSAKKQEQLKRRVNTSVKAVK